MFLTADLRTRESVAKLIKKPQKCGFIYFGRTYCAIHEPMKSQNCCNLGKKLKRFYN